MEIDQEAVQKGETYFADHLKKYRYYIEVCILVDGSVPVSISLPIPFVAATLEHLQNIP